MTERKLLTLDDFVKEPTTTTRFGEKVTRNPIEQVYNAGLLSDYKKLAISHKYIRFTGMFEEGDGAEGWYIRDESITDDEDIGVIIYIGQYKYRRLYGAYVLVDWFYTGDFGIALQRACKYASVRCIPGKEYNCASSITLKLNIRTAVTEHGSIDYGHVLIDLRGATINYTAENTSYCFNIRLYHRDTKFMLTNGNFIISENAKVSLKNIANIIGGNNYTDMLTDMHYNVDKALLPDTNRVVLFSEPVIEGIKTFENAFNYIGDSNSAENNQAVTKEYMPEAINEEAYIALEDTRKIEGVLAFNQIVDRLGNNLVAESEVSNIVLEAAKTTLEGLMNSADISIYLPFMYYTKHIQAESPVKILGGNWEEQLLLSTDEYNVFKQQQSNYIIIPQSRVIIDENEIGEEVYIKCVLNKPINVNSDYVSSINITTNTEGIQYVFKNNKVADSIAIITHSAIIDDNLYKLLTEKYVRPKDYILYVPITIPTPRYDSASMNWPKSSSEAASYTDICKYSKYVLYIGIDDVTYIIPTYDITQIYIQSIDKLFILIHSYIGSFNLSRASIKGTINSFTAFTFNNLKYISDFALTTPTNITEYMQIHETNFDLNLLNININYGAEYISINTPKIIARLQSTWDGNFYEDGRPIVTHYITHFYINGIVPVQANLNPFLTADSTQPCVQLNFVFEYNKEIINTSYINFYMPRYIATGVPEYELPPDIRVKSVKTAINAKYPTSFIYANNSCIPKKFTICNQLAINDQSFVVHRLSGSTGGENRSYDSKDFCYTTGVTKDDVSSQTLKMLCVDNNIKYISNSLNWQFGIGASLVCEGKVCKNGSHLCSRYYNGPILCIPGYNLSFVAEVSKDYDFNASKIINLAIREFTPIIEFTLQPGEVKVVSTYAENTSSNGHYLIPEQKIGPFTASSYSRHCRDCAGMSDGFIDYYCTLSVATKYLLSFNTGLNKNKLLSRLFGTGGFSEYILRDGILKDPFRERTLMPEHAFAAPVCVLNP